LGEEVDGGVHGLAGHDEEDDLPGLGEGEDEFFGLYCFKGEGWVSVIRKMMMFNVEFVQ